MVFSITSSPPFGRIYSFYFFKAFEANLSLFTWTAQSQPPLCGVLKGWNPHKYCLCLGGEISGFWWIVSCRVVSPVLPVLVWTAFSSCCQAGGVKNPLKHKKGGWLYEEFLVRVPQIIRGGGNANPKQLRWWLFWLDNWRVKSDTHDWKAGVFHFLFPRFLQKWWLAGFFSESIEKGDEMNPLHDLESLSEHLPAVDLRYGKSTWHRKWMVMVFFFSPRAVMINGGYIFPLMIFTVNIL